MSVSNTIPRHKSRFWSVQFPLSIRSSKFPSEIFHTMFDLLYFVKEMFNGKEIRHASSPVPKQFKELRKSLVWLLRKLMFRHERFLDHSLSEI